MRVLRPNEPNGFDRLADAMEARRLGLVHELDALGNPPAFSILDPTAPANGLSWVAVVVGLISYCIQRRVAKAIRRSRRRSTLRTLP